MESEVKKNGKKWRKVRIIGAISLLVVGAAFGLVALYMNGWSFVKFITNPTTILIILVVVAIVILMFSWKETK